MKYLKRKQTNSSFQENKYKEAIGFYEPIVKKHYDNVGHLWSSFA